MWFSMSTVSMWSPILYGNEKKITILDVILLNSDHEAKREIPIIAKKDDANINIPLMSIPHINIIKTSWRENGVGAKYFFT